MPRQEPGRSRNQAEADTLKSAEADDLNRAEADDDKMPRQMMTGAKAGVLKSAEADDENAEAGVLNCLSNKPKQLYLSASAPSRGSSAWLLQHRAEAGIR